MKLTISTLSTLLIFLSVKKPLLGFDSAQEISTINSTSSLILAAGHGTDKKTIPLKDSIIFIIT